MDYPRPCGKLRFLGVAAVSLLSPDQSDRRAWRKHSAVESKIMRTTLLQTFFLSTIMAWPVTAAVAAEPAADASSVYKLKIARPADFRLKATGPRMPAPQFDKTPAVPAQLAGKPFAKLIQSAARGAALDPALVHALIYVESRYNPSARSTKGAVGLMQVLPETASRYGVAKPARSPEANLRAGTRYLSDLLQTFDGRLDLALAAYNAGENAVQRYGRRIPPYPETRAYVPAVLAKYRELQSPAPAITTPGRVHIEYMPGTRLDSEAIRAWAMP